MSTRLRHYLIDAYENRRSVHQPSKADPRYPIQIDDQDDNDKLTEFCTVFCTVCKNDSFTLELTGALPLTTYITERWAGKPDTCPSP